jgi:hypothetical protein
MYNPPVMRSLARQDRPPQQRRHFFLNVDDDLGFAQFLGQPFILAAELLVFFLQRTALRVGEHSTSKHRAKTVREIGLNAICREQKQMP